MERKKQRKKERKERKKQTNKQTKKEKKKKKNFFVSFTLWDNLNVIFFQLNTSVPFGMSAAVLFVSVYLSAACLLVVYLLARLVVCYLSVFYSSL
jgi:hypothetical protein